MIDMTQKDKALFLETLADRMKINPDVILSMYILIGDDIFLLLSLLEKQQIRFPALRTVRSEIAKVPTGELMELKSKQVRLKSGMWIKINELKKGDIFIHQKTLYECSCPSRDILLHTYVIATKIKGM